NLAKKANDIILFMFNEQRVWQRLDDSDRNITLRQLDLRDYDFIDADEISKETSLSTITLQPSIPTLPSSILSSDANDIQNSAANFTTDKITLRLCTKPRKRESYVVISILRTSTINDVKIKAIDQLSKRGIPSNPVQLLLYIHCIWEGFDKEKGDITLQQLHIRNDTYISMETEENHLSDKKRTFLPENLSHEQHHSRKNIKDQIVPPSTTSKTASIVDNDKVCQSLSNVSADIHQQNQKQNQSTDKDKTEMKKNYSIIYPPGLCGLTNTGNTCFMNSALQCLSNIPELTQYFLNPQENNNNNNRNTPVTLAYKHLIQSMWSGKHSCIVPNEIKYRVSQIDRIFSDNRQHDSHEFVNSMINILYNESINNENNNKLTKIKEIFHGQISSTVKCLQCPSTETVVELINCLPLPLAASNKVSKQEQNLIKIDYIQINGNHESILVELSKKNSTLEILIEKFINNYIEKNISESSSTNTREIPSEALIPERDRVFIAELIQNRFIYPYTNINEPLHNTNVIRPCLFEETESVCCFRPPVYLLISTMVKLHEHLNIILDHIYSVTNQKCVHNIYWTKKGYSHKHNLNFDVEFDLSTIDQITIELPSSIVSKYEKYYGKKYLVNMNDAPLTLDNLMNDFFKEDLLDGDYYCQKCGATTQAKQKSDICLPLPTVLIIQLKRFKFNNSYINDKINTLIEYPINDFDLSKYIKDDMKKTNKKIPLYDLIAVSNHSGGTSSFGHYTTYAKNSFDGQWYSFNDLYIRKITNTKDLLTDNAYVLFYSQRKE
ncbi:unnamed protein product, partial [Didymodactylos carnosus]